MLWIKALHIISVVCWFAVLFYLPRLFVYHAEAESEEMRKQFELMERRLYKGIGMPSMIATIVFGLGLIHFNWDYLSQATWFWIKMVIIILLIGYHHICGAYIKKFVKGEMTKSSKFFRLFNEIPTVVLLVVVIMAVTKLPA